MLARMAQLQQTEREREREVKKEMATG